MHFSGYHVLLNYTNLRKEKQLLKTARFLESIYEYIILLFYRERGNGRWVYNFSQQYDPNKLKPTKVKIMLQIHHPDLLFKEIIWLYFLKLNMLILYLFHSQSTFYFQYLLYPLSLHLYCHPSYSCNYSEIHTLISFLRTVLIHGISQYFSPFLLFPTNSPVQLKIT